MPLLGLYRRHKSVRLAVQLFIVILVVGGFGASLALNVIDSNQAARAAADAHRAAGRAEQIANCVKDQLTARNTATAGDAQALRLVITGLDRFEGHVFPPAKRPTLAQYQQETQALRAKTNEARVLVTRDQKVRSAHPFSGC